MKVIGSFKPRRTAAVFREFLQHLDRISAAKDMLHHKRRRRVVRRKKSATRNMEASNG